MIIFKLLIPIILSEVVVCYPFRFKLHLEVIDNTGSTTFVLYDRVVTQAVGKSAQYFLHAMTEKNSAEIPPELNMFVDQRMLFKVEVSDSNLYRNWRSYTVRKLTMDDDIINRFITLHGISLANDEENAEYVETTCELADKDPLELLEGVDSSNKEEGAAVDSEVTPTSKALGKRSADKEEGAAVDSEVTLPSKALGKRSADKDEGAAVDSQVTPTNKALGKRSADRVESLDDLEVIGGDASTTKEPKLVRVKVEKID
ncbi:uncharacterized protein [Medicago truncatula]|uniref:uncharacterized protein n=1 Tax=Medicago truncatula TaxID=3880 RepID=UPI0019671213|nr:uncharacterized protein LOC25485806 [Medicago truncatula]